MRMLDTDSLCFSTHPKHQAEEASGPDGKTRSNKVVKDDEDAWVETHIGRSESKLQVASFLDQDDQDGMILTDLVVTCM